MPASPDFDQIALRLMVIASARPPELGAEIKEELRRVWNARGAADQHAVEDRLSTLTGWVTSEPYRQHLKEAIRQVDR